MAKILVTCGPIPAKLDSVKVITNRFKGGLSFKTAGMLADMGHDVTVIRWVHLETKVSPSIKKIINVNEINDYKDAVLGFNADIYVLSAAIANLMPSDPWEGKFPSHNYKVGEKFNIEFEIAPRIIDMVKKKHPKSGLVGYKLFDGTDEELINAGWETLINSKANIVFANHPKWAKEMKIMLTSDGSETVVSFDNHVRWIDKLARAKFYRTVTKSGVVYPDIPKDLKLLSENYPQFEKHGFTFGTFAYRWNGGFITTTRGKKWDKWYTRVLNVDHRSRVIEATPYRATLNAPLLDAVLKKNPKFNVLIHGHEERGYPVPYELPGTKDEVELAKKINFNRHNAFYIENHGYIAGFKTVDECIKWMKGNE